MGDAEGGRASETEDDVLPAPLRPRNRQVSVAVVELERELRRVLPEGFVDAYLALHLRALGLTQRRRDDVGVARGTPLRARTSTGQTETRGGAHNHKTAGKDRRGVIGDEAALAQRQRVDRRLKKMARDIRVWMREDTARRSVRRCGRCGQYAEDTWSFCPFDGAPTQEVN